METIFSITVRSTDLDGLGHVNNSVYFEYFEQARLEHLARMGFLPRYASGNSPKHWFAIGETTCRYKAPAYYRDALLVKVKTTEVRLRSFALAYEVTRESDAVLVAEGSSVQVWLDDRGHAAPLPEAFKQALECSRGSE